MAQSVCEWASNLMENGFLRRLSSNPGHTRGRQPVSFRFYIMSPCPFTILNQATCVCVLCLCVVSVSVCLTVSHPGDKTSFYRQKAIYCNHKTLFNIETCPNVSAIFCVRVRVRVRTFYLHDL